MPYNQVWQFAKDFNFKIPNIMEGPLSSLNREVVTKEILEAWEELFKLEKGIFKNIPHMKDLVAAVKK